MASLRQFTHYSLPVVLHEIQSEMNRLFDQTSELSSEGTSTLLGQWVPAVDIEDKETCLVFRLDIPGVDPKNIDVSINNGELIVKGEKETEKTEERKNYYRTERYCGSFYRRFALPENIDASKISAKNKHGVLEITVPKTDKVRAKKIEIKSEE